MSSKEAIEMLTHPALSGSERKSWADLGCGRGTFTIALASLLPDESIIYALDKNRTDLESIPERHGLVTIIKSQGDFTKAELPVELDGIVMGNALHYVKDQRGFINKVRDHMRPDGCFLIVEYELAEPNPWVPYPIPFDRLKDLFIEAGFSTLYKLQERSSTLNDAFLYSAIAFR